MKRLLICGGTVVDPSQGLEGPRDILIEDGKILALAPNLDVSDAETWDAKGLHALPGLIDMHVHFREPGQEHKETYASGTRSAALGGVTSVVPMANTNPIVEKQADLKYASYLAQDQAIVNVFPVAAATVGQKGEELTEYADLKENGAIALSDDGRPIMNGAVMRRVLEYSAMVGLPLLLHEEDTNLSAHGSMHEGYWSTYLGLPGIPPAAEEVMIARDLILADETRGSIHIQHVSTSRAVDLIRIGKSRGIRVTAEATPHHFTLTDEAVRGYRTSAKMNPPLRTARDREAVIEGLRDGTLDLIATDHAPHTRHEKEQEFDLAPFGIIGLETLFPLTYTQLVLAGHLSLSEAIRKLTIEPARVLGLEKGSLRPGADADLTLVDLSLRRVYTEAEIQSKSRNTPFIGTELQGWPVGTIVGGKVVMRERSVVG
ncbi:MAG: dihydroorotase [Candidatus Omnitrophica bacterium]|nr:Dihydroorotase [bacterium]NUN97206.1 dihydroorotase [Candidatus Omnitrophota bacterium]